MKNRIHFALASSSSAQVPSGTMVFNPMGGNRTQDANASTDKCNQEKETGQNTSTRTTKASCLDGKESIESSTRPRFADEDYIVFCFREDGAIHVLKDRKSETSWDHFVDHHPVSTGTPTRAAVNRKLIYGEVAEEHYNNNTSSCHDHELNEDERNICSANELGDSIICNIKKGKAKWSINYLDSSMPTQNRTDSKESSKAMVSAAESSDSNQSDSSSSSFAFPVLGWEGADSPVQMPKPDTLRLWRHKTRAVLCLCNRF